MGSQTRLLMLSFLSHRSLNLSALAEAINLPQSTTAFHLKQLENAGLVDVQYIPGTRGQQKMITKRFDEVHIRLPGVAVEQASNVVDESMPIGNFKRISVTPTCGLATDTKHIGMVDDPRSFYEPDHVFAQILWFRRGFVEYDFPNNIPYGAKAVELQFSMEICSEAPEYDLDWPSDITQLVNGVEAATWTSPGDFGGTRGRLTPAWWPIEHTQFGVLKRWRITADGTYVDGEKYSDINLSHLALGAAPHICMRLEVKSDARHVGGINLFGKRFGNYNQDIIMRTRYEIGGEEVLS